MYYYVIKCTCNKYGVKETQELLCSSNKTSFNCKFCGKNQTIFKKNKPSLTISGEYHNARTARDVLIALTNVRITEHEKIIRAINNIKKVI